jgi:hypothetical protein
MLRIERADRSTLALIDEMGEVTDGSVVGYVTADGTIEDAGRTTIGYVNDDGRIEDGGRETVAFVSEAGRIENRQRETVGWVANYAQAELRMVAAFWLLLRRP